MPLSPPIRRRVTGLLAAVGCLSALGGCAKLQPTRLDYRTIGTDPNHDTERAQKLNEKAIRALEKGKCDEAEQLWQESLIADVSFGPAHNNLGRAYFQHGKYYLAAWEYEYAMRLMQDQPEPANNLALVYETVGKIDEAVAMYETAHGMQPENGEYFANLVRARWKRGDRDPEILGLMRELTFRDARPQWRGWAEEQVVFYESHKTPFVPASAPAAEPLITVPPAEEILPLPPSPEQQKGTAPSGAPPIPKLQLQ